MRLYLSKLVAVLSVVGSAGFASADALYNAGLGTLPQGQGWSYSGDFGNPTPFVAGGLLHEVKNLPDTAQYWNITDHMDIAQHVFLEGDIRINSSNYVPNVGTGTREGYYFSLSDRNSLGYDIGLSDAGFSINTIQVPNAPLVPYPVAGAFHTYSIDVNQSLANFYIDGVLEESNIAPYFAGSGIAVDQVLFGAAAGASMTDSDLRSVCETTSGTCSVSSATPEPSTFTSAGMFLLLGAGFCCLSVRRKRAQNPCLL